MTSLRLLDIAGGWVMRAGEAVKRNDNTTLTIAILAHGMCFAYLGDILSEAKDADPVTPSPKLYRVRR